MEPVTIQLIGHPVVTAGRQPISFPTRKVLALLVYLVVEGGQPHRETLMALLWPESEPEKAALSLRGTLSRLRKLLQPAGEYLLTSGATVAFDFTQPHHLDLAWLAAAAGSDLPAVELDPILDLDRGEFLEGFTLPDAPAFDNWAAVQREICQRQVETVYDRLSQHLLANHDHAAAVVMASRWVARAPLSEQAYRRLMAAQALNGQRPAAMQTYARLQATLQEELGLEPGRETTMLADQIGRGRVVEDQPVRPTPTGPVPAIAPGRRMTLPLVGRANEHAQMVAAFRRTGREGAQVVALIGAAGVGKTRLVSSFQEWAMLDLPETEIWTGRAFETGGRLAFQPVVEALRPRLEQVNAPEDLLDDVWLAELSQLMPELRARYPDLPPPLTGDAHFVRARLFEAVAMLGSALAADRPAVFLLDDLQWADTDTLDLIHYLSRRWVEAGTPVLLLLTLRQENYASDIALREWLTRLERDIPLTRILLDSLSGAAVQELIARLAGRPEDDVAIAGFATYLWAETRGLPFFIEALLQMLVEQGRLAATGEQQAVYDFSVALAYVRSTARVPLPPGVREVIQARLTQHSKAANALLLAAAVLGRACTFERLCQVADLSEQDALEALEALLDGRLMAERPAERQPYILAHDYIREVVYSESREARRRVFHRRALLGLEASGAPAAECAFHALPALLDEPAFRYSVAAGSEAFAAYATQDALNHFDTARDTARRMQERGEYVESGLLSRLYQQRGQILALIQDDKGAEANYEEMLELAVQQRNQAMELAALISQSTLYGSYTDVFNPSKARVAALQALKQARELGDKQSEAGALWALTVTEFFSSGHNRLLLDYGRKGLALARELGLKELVGGTLNILCWPLVGEKQLEQAYAALNEAQDIWRELGNLQRLGEAYRFKLIIHFVSGDLHRMLHEAPELVDLSIVSGSRLDQLNALMWLAHALTLQGRFGQAQDYLDQTGVLAEAIGYANEAHGYAVGRIKFYLAVGVLAEAESWADRLYAQRETIMPTLSHYYLTVVALAQIACGKLDLGQAILDERLAGLQADAPESHIITLIAVAYGYLHLAQDRPEDLFLGLEERVRPYREAGFNYYLAEEYWLRGRAEMALGHYEAAREALLKARDAAEAQEERAVLWQILVSLAEVEQVCGDAERAESLRDEAREVVGYIAEHAGELRETFLARPEVQSLQNSN